MHLASAILVIDLLSNVLGSFKEVSILVDRVKAGEVITDEEIEEAREKVKEAVSKWDKPKT